VGINLADLGDVLTEGKHVLRGLNPAFCVNGLPTEGCFMLKTKDRAEDGPSLGILKASEELAAQSPLGVRQGVKLGVFSALLHKLEYGVARLNVGDALAPVADRGRICPEGR